MNSELFFTQMKKITYLLFLPGISALLLTPFLSYSQELSKDSVQKLEALHKPLLKTDTIDFKQRKITRLEEDLFKVEDKFAGGALASVKYSRGIPARKYFPSINTSTEFYPGGGVRATETFHDSSNVYIFKRYYSSGHLYIEGQRGYAAVEEVSGLYDYSGKQTVINGDGNGVLFIDRKDTFHLETGAFRNKKRDGNWKGYSASGNLMYEEEYNSGERVSGISYDEMGKKYEYREVEKSPEFKGGKREMYKFIADNVRYPPSAAKRRITGRVEVQFVIEKDGSVGEIQKMNSVHRLLDDEAVRVVKATSGKWTPGLFRGQPVRTHYTLPISFNAW